VILKAQSQPDRGDRGETLTCSTLGRLQPVLTSTPRLCFFCLGQNQRDNAIAHLKTKYEVVDGVPTLIRLPKISFINDKDGKPVGINQYIGERPALPHLADIDRVGSNIR
jgi:hypothetical protein